MKSITWKVTCLSLAASAVLLAGCGGGGGGVANLDTPSMGSDALSSAAASSAGALAFVKSVAAATDDAAEPIAIGDATLAASDTDEPDPDI